MVTFDPKSTKKDIESKIIEITIGLIVSSTKEWWNENYFRVY